MRIRHTILMLLPLLFTILIDAIGVRQPVLAVQSAVTDFLFDDPRPLAKAAEEFEKQFGWIITYEDPPYLFAGDARDVTLEVRRDYTRPLSQPILIPKGHPFVFRLDEATRRGGPGEVLDALVKAHASSGNPGAFRVIAAPPMFHLVPTVPYRAVLDVAISLPAGRRTVMSVIDEIARAVTDQTGIYIGIAIMPLNLLNQRQVEGGAANEPARDVLRRILMETGHSLSWVLFSGPNTTRSPLLSIRIVNTEPQEK